MVCRENGKDITRSSRNLWEVHARTFFVKQNNREFNAVAAPDMKLEQTIQRSKESVEGISGQRRQVAYVSQIMCHEILAIRNSFRQLINAEVGYCGTVIHHES